MEEIKRRCRFCEKEHFGGQRVCRQCIERERERETKNQFVLDYLLNYMQCRSDFFGLLLVKKK